MTVAQLQRVRDIEQHIHELVGSITTANGYATDIGTRVFRGRRKINDEQVPCSVIVIGNDKRVDEGSTTTIKTMKLFTIGGYMPCDPDNPNDMGLKMISDIKKALFKKPVTTTPPNPRDRHPGTADFNGRVKDVKYLGSDIGPRADGEAIVFAIVDIAVTFVEDLIDA